MTTTMRSCLVAACALVFPAVAAAAQVSLSSVWMRPAVAGAQSARVYVDIKSDANVDLVGASSPAAKKVEIVTVKTIGDPASESVVKKYAVPGGTTTRLAYLGDHLRLVGVKRTVNNGDPVPITLRFVDAKGKRFDVESYVTVRGLAFPGGTPPK
jgi:periplasmic copper chaperone A